MKRMALINICIMSYCLAYCISNNEYLSLVVNDLDRISTYNICIDVKGSANGRYVIENGNLYSYFFRNGCEFSEEEYTSFIYLHLKYHLPIYLNWEIDNSFKKVEDVPSVIKAAGQGKKSFLKRFFRLNGCIKKEVGQKEEIAIIAQLFYWKMLSFYDCETGYLCIEKSNVDSVGKE